jgi:outer membrane receptor protein involved in Fe transport
MFSLRVPIADHGSRLRITRGLHADMSLQLRRTYHVVAMLALGVATIAGAQQPERSAADTVLRRDSVKRLPTVEVHASIAPSAGPNVGGVVGSLTIVDGAELRRSRPRVLPDLLANVAGVSAFDDLGSPWKLNLSMRGFAAGPTVGSPAGLTVFVDGVRQNEADAQEVNFDLLPMEDVSRIEVLRGNASLLGPNSLGGAINLITARGGDAPASTIELSGGSFGDLSARGSLGGEGPSDVDYYLGAGVERERGWRDATGARTFNVFANVGRTTGARSVTLQAFAASSRAETAGSLPESLFGSAPRLNFTPGDVDALEAQQLSLRAHAPMLSGTGSVTAYLRHSYSERFNVNQAPDPDVRSRTANVTVGATASWHRAFVAGGNPIDMRLGADVAANRVRARIFNERPGESSELTTDVRSPSLDAALYALADARFGAFALSGGGRLDHVRVPFSNMLNVADNTTSHYTSFSPRVGLSVVPRSGLTMYVSVGKSFRAPAILELGCADPEAECPLPFALGDDPPLAPVRATSYEAGASLATRWVIASVATYRTNVRDEVFFVASEGALSSGYFTNLDRTRREGVEVSLAGALARNRIAWRSSAALGQALFLSDAELFSVRSDADFVDSPYYGDNAVRAGSRMPLVPDLTLTAGVTAAVTRRLSVRLDVRRVGRQWLRGDEANATTRLDPYTVAGVGADWSAGGWGVSVSATNLFDVRAATFGAYNENRRTGELERFLTPLNGRGVKVTLRRLLGARGDDLGD